MNEAVVAALTVKYDTMKRGRDRLPVAHALCEAAGEAHLGHALEIGRHLVKTSRDPRLVAYREARSRRARQTTRQYNNDLRNLRAAV